MVLTPSNIYGCHFSAMMDHNLEPRPQINLFFSKLLMSGCLIAAIGNEARLIWMWNGPHRLTCGPNLVPSWLSCCRKQWVWFTGRHRSVVAAPLGYTSPGFLPWCTDLDHRLKTPWNWSLVQIPYISLLPSQSILHDTLSSPGSLQPLLTLPSWCEAFPCPYAHSLLNRLWVRRQVTTQETRPLHSTLIKIEPLCDHDARTIMMVFPPLMAGGISICPPTSSDYVLHIILLTVVLDSFTLGLHDCQSLTTQHSSNLKRSSSVTFFADRSLIYQFHCLVKTFLFQKLFHICKVWMSLLQKKKSSVLKPMADRMPQVENSMLDLRQQVAAKRQTAQIIKNTVWNCLRARCLRCRWNINELSV